MSGNRKAPETRKGKEDEARDAQNTPDHDQDSEPPRTAVPPAGDDDEGHEWGRDEGC